VEWLPSLIENRRDLTAAAQRETRPARRYRLRHRSLARSARYGKTISVTGMGTQINGGLNALFRRCRCPWRGSTISSWIWRRPLRFGRMDGFGVTLKMRGSRRLTVRDVYNHPTIARLASAIGARTGSRASFGPGRHCVSHAANTRSPLPRGAIQSARSLLCVGVRGMQWIAPWARLFLCW